VIRQILKETGQYDCQWRKAARPWGTDCNIIAHAPATPNRKAKWGLAEKTISSYSATLLPQLAS